MQPQQLTAVVPFITPDRLPLLTAAIARRDAAVAAVAALSEERARDRRRNGAFDLAERAATAAALELAATYHQGTAASRAWW